MASALRYPPRLIDAIDPASPAGWRRHVGARPREIAATQHQDTEARSYMAWSATLQVSGCSRPVERRAPRREAPGRLAQLVRALP